MVSMTFLIWVHLIAFVFAFFGLIREEIKDDRSVTIGIVIGRLFASSIPVINLIIVAFIYSNPVARIFKRIWNFKLYKGRY